MNRRVKTAAATIVSKYCPSLLYYRAGTSARDGISVSASCERIDVVNKARRQIIRLSRSNALYCVDMIESFDYFFSSAEPIRICSGGATFEMVDFSTPRLHRVTGFDDFAVLCPSLTEPYSTTEQYLDFARLDHGAGVIDLGAYSALTSIAFSKAVGPTGSVVAVEPDPLNHFAAAANIATHGRVNGLTNIALIAAAAADKPGRMQLSSEGAMGSALTSIVGAHRGASIEVECLTLQGLADRGGLSSVDFVKMDIEGAEQSVIEGNLDFFARHRPRIVIEAHLLNGRMTSEPVMAALSGIGYDCRMMDQSGLSLPLITAAPPAASGSASADVAGRPPGVTFAG